LGTSSFSFLGGFISIFVKVLDEQGSEALGSLVVVALVLPGILGIEHFRRNAGAGFGDLEAKEIHLLGGNLFEFTTVDGIDDGSGDLKVHSLSFTVFTTTPTSVDEPGVSSVLIHLFSEHFSIDGGVKRQEDFTEASREGSLGFLDTDFGTSDLSSVTRDEVVHSLGVVQLSNGREDTVSIASKEKDVLGVTTDGRDLAVGDILKGISGSGVFSDGNILVINFSVDIISEQNVFQDGTESNSVENFGFLFGRKVDTLGVATTFDVEDTIGSPAVFVITDQLSLGVSRKSGLTSSGQTEQQGNVTLFTFVGGGVERKDSFLGHQVVHNTKDTLLHFSGVLGAENRHSSLGKVDGNTGLGGNSFNGRGSGEFTGVDDMEINFSAEITGELFGSGDDEHVSHKESVICTRADDSDGDSVTRIPTGITINDVETGSSIQIGDSSFFDELVGLLSQGEVDGAPPDILGVFILDDTLVLGRSTGLDARVGAEGTGAGDGGQFGVGVDWGNS